ncbi:carbohydrate ABC transporter substrate-binding protein (CUT1 family) [Actinocorallia herbida]|uniref:Carbohydrate ABC transporter substrate-binding protein (CUT1 family) n=1 Tax=Actinocorallia herbida TaxID=58109 RepID=A0A3N1D6E5_9ACTN|nr:extracellular solute-binding protein [Actinocorallia herbida]ROO89107.1 carbohydrate ABC transporter substrate-binding protein (CUT1 family) [Actinocorallia herbida]
MKKWKVIAAAASLALGAAACSDPGTSTSTDDAAAITWADPTAKLDGQKLTIWAAQNSNTVPEKVVKGFEAATGAKVEIVTIPDPYEQGIQTKVATGDKPDLAFWQPTASMLTAINAKTNLQPLDDAPWLSELSPDVKDLTGLLNDTRYAALVTSPAVQGVYYNKEVFEKAGVKATPKNFADMVETARGLKSKGVTPFYEMAADRWGTQWWVQVQLADAAKDGLWDKVNAGETKFTDPVILDTIKNYKSLIDEGLFNKDIKTATFEDQGKALLNGDAAMVVQVNSFFGQLQALAETPELNEKIGFFPIAPSGNVGTYIPDQANALVAFKTGDAKREAAARQLLSYWMGPGYADFVADQQTVSLKTSVESPAGVPQALLDAHASLGDAAGSMQALAIANPDLYINLADMITGQMTPEQVAKATQDQFAQLAQAAGASGF